MSSVLLDVLNQEAVECFGQKSEPCHLNRPGAPILSHDVIPSSSACCEFSLWHDTIKLDIHRYRLQHRRSCQKAADKSRAI